MENAASQNASTISRLCLDELEVNFLRKNPNALNSLMQTLLREANGKKTLLDIAEALSIPFRIVRSYANLLESKNIITVLDS